MRWRACLLLHCSMQDNGKSERERSQGSNGHGRLAVWKGQVFAVWLTKFIDGVGQEWAKNANARHCSWCQSRQVLGEQPAHKAARSFAEDYESSKHR
jgi:hypothetical protein